MAITELIVGYRFTSVSKFELLISLPNIVFSRFFHIMIIGHIIKLFS